jgi:uncharacterized membrane protein
VPLVPRLIIAVLLVVAGLVLLAVAVLGARGRLRRNRWVGVRTAETLASDAAFALANRVAAAPVGAAGAVALVGGGVLLAGPVGAVSVVVLAVSAVGTLVLGAFGGMVGQRAALAAPVPEPVACGGVCAGCDLVAGCRPTSPTSPDLP